jgi:D-glycero-D-manno-heptose 1,7-bisphosphate phosphatase
VTLRAVPSTVFLDRDGTLNVAPPPGDYVERPVQLRLIAGAAKAVRMLNDAGVWTSVVTNQRGIALGRMSLADLDAVHDRLRTLLADEHARIDAIYACPHGLDACECRKPLPGLLLQAQREHPAIDLTDAAMVGDSSSDMLAGRRLGLTTVLLRDHEARQSRGQAPDHSAAGDLQPDYVADDLLEAVRWLLGA